MPVKHYNMLKNIQTYEKLCGFDYLNSTLLDPLLGPAEELYGNCSENRNYLCKNKSTSKLDVRNGTRESVQCNEVIRDSDLNDNRNNIIPGYYWTSNIRNMTTEIGTSVSVHRNRSVLCGAFKKTVGKYFIKCDKYRFSLCRVNGSISKHCFRESISDRNETEVSTEDKAEQRTEQEHDSNIAVKVGVPVAILLALICGSLISIYLSRRYKCWQSRKSTNDNVRANTPSSPAAHKLSKDIPIKISYRDEKAYVPKGNENYYTDSNSQYATVNKNMKRPHAQTRPGKSKMVEYNSVQRNDTDTCNNEMNSYCYAFTNGDNFANPKEIQTAEYSFATELDGEVVNAKVHCNVTEGDYDVSGKAGTCSVNKSNNIYNTLQSGEYDSSAHVLKRNNCNHVYGVPQNAGSESVYDSVEQGNGSKQLDNIYNQLTNKASGSDKENK
ncbi:uncharacterized protein LOC128559282 [Mercenaria mercenaria]|uniref:uncharacterized protein LOC128559282 n=1 Tax=Mercenaria mercenaria TaxID=6596 RepID=UPI00234EC604|nr:uncharacterized protein LOC128559282 [Mercenaria mercenaria]